MNGMPGRYTAMLLCALSVLAGTALSGAVAQEVSPSTIVVPMTIKIEVARQAINAGTPMTESGAREGVLGSPVTWSRLSWTFNRGDITLWGGNNSLQARTSVSGVVRIEGEAQFIRGSVGSILGKLNPTRIAFSAHTDLGASVSMTATPILLPNWRLAPNINAAVDVTEANIPVANLTSVSVRNEIQPKVNDKVNAIVADLNTKLAGDPFIETAAAKAWADLCKAHKIVIEGRDKPVWLIVKPKAIHASPVAIDGDNIYLTVGITAETKLSDVEFQPTCIALPQLTDPPAREGFALSVPVAVSYGWIGTELTAALADEKLEIGSTGITLVPGEVKAESSGGRVKLTLAFEVKQGGFLEFLFGGATGKLEAIAKPVVDAASQTLSFADVELSVASDDALNSAAVATGGMAPLVSSLIESKARVDLTKNAKEAADKANSAILRIKESDLGGLRLSEASVSDISLTSIEVEPDALTAVVTAKGKLAVEVRELNFN